MLLLGLHFGHDASVAVVRDGHILAHVVRERVNRVKHAGGLDRQVVEVALREAGVTLGKVSAVAVSSTQGVELLFEETGAFELNFCEKDPWGVPCYYLDEITDSNLSADALGVRGLAHFLFDEDYAGTWLAKSFAAMFPRYSQGEYDPSQTVPFIDNFVSKPEWDEGAGFRELAGRTVQLSERDRYGFHLPVEITLLGRRFPGYLVHHHLAHAANTYYSSGMTHAAVLSHDGHSYSQSYHAGMYYYGDGKALYPLSPHHLHLGAVYDRVGHALGLGHVGPAGKLMGLFRIQGVVGVGASVAG